MVRYITSALSKLSPVSLVTLAIPVFFIAFPDGIPFAFADCGSPWQAVSAGRTVIVDTAPRPCGPVVSLSATEVPIMTGCGMSSTSPCCAIKVSYTLTFAAGVSCCVHLNVLCSGSLCTNDEQIKCGSGGGSPTVITDTYTRGCKFQPSSVRIKFEACTCCSCTPELMYESHMSCL
jgi:hypothetical protein